MMQKIKQINPFFIIAACFTALACAVSAAVYVFSAKSEETAAVYSHKGSSGREVEAIQTVLADRGLFDAEITGYYGEKTEEAVIKFQKQQGLTPTGIADEKTLKLLGITIGQIPQLNEANVTLLARIISAEGRGEPYIGQVAIGAVVMNRIEHPSFPDTLAGIIYEDGAFTALVDGQFNEPIAKSAYYAARDALNGWDPTGGCIYYYNPSKTTNQFMTGREVILSIGDHLFCI